MNATCVWSVDAVLRLLDEHQERIGGARCTMSADKGTVILSLNSAGDKTSVPCMDLQAVFLTPRTKASSPYYKIKLCVYHVTFYNGVLTANQFAPIVTLIDRFADNPGFSRSILYSDGSTYQNRHSTLSKALYILQSHTVSRYSKTFRKGPHVHRG